MKLSDIFGALLTIIGVEVVGMVSSLLAGDIEGKYAALNKPPLSPPGSVFGIAWTALYALMGLSVYLIYRTQAPKNLKKRAYLWFGIQLVLNFSWSIIFFGMGSLWGGAIVAILMVVFTAGTIYYFFEINKIAAYLLVPYLLWILFATYLSIGFAFLN